MEEGSLVSRESIEEPFYRCSEQLEKTREVVMLQLRFDIQVSLAVKYSSLPPMVLSHAHVYCS